MTSTNGGQAWFAAERASGPAKAAASPTPSTPTPARAHAPAPLPATLMCLRVGPDARQRLVASGGTDGSGGAPRVSPSSIAPRKPIVYDVIDNDP